MNHLLQKLRQGWRKLAASLNSNEQAEQQLLQALQRDYHEELRISEALQKESERIPYSHLRKILLDIAAQEKTHADLLLAKIRELGSEVPERAGELREQRISGSFASTLDLLKILEEEKEEYREYLKAAHLARQTQQADLENLLRQIAEDERIHREQLLEVTMKLNPLPLYQ